MFSNKLEICMNCGTKCFFTDLKICIKCGSNVNLAYNKAIQYINKKAKYYKILYTIDFITIYKIKYKVELDFLYIIMPKIIGYKKIIKKFKLTKKKVKFENFVTKKCLKHYGCGKKV